MDTWREDWRDKRVDRLEGRIYAIEEARRKEKQRASERAFYAALVVLWLVMIASIVVPAIAASS